MANSIELNDKKSPYETSKDTLNKELSSIFSELKKLRSEITKTNNWVDDRLNKLSSKINEIEQRLLELFLWNISSIYYEKVWLKWFIDDKFRNWKIIYNWWIDLVSDTNILSIVSFSDIPEKLRKDLNLIQETINFLKWLLAFDKRDYFSTIEFLKKIKNPFYLNDYYYNQALWLSYLYTKQLEISLWFFEKIKTNNKEELYATLMNKAAALRELWLFEQAKTTYEEVLTKNPWDSTGLFALGILHRVIWHSEFKKWDYEQALKSYQEWAKILSKSDNRQSVQYAHKSYFNTWVAYYKLWRTDLANEVFSYFAEDESMIKYLSQNEIDSLIWWLYHSSKWDPKRINQALKIAEKYSPKFKAHLEWVINWTSEYKWESVFQDAPIIIIY